MQRNRFYLGATGSIALALLSAIVILFEPEYILLSALGTAASILSLRFARNISRKKGRDDRMKAVLSSTSILYELTILLAVFSLPIVPKYLVSVTLAAIFFSELFRLEMIQKLKLTYTRFFNREKRMIVLAVSIGGYSFNNYLLFYGILIIALISVYSSLRTLYGLTDQV